MSHAIPQRTAVSGITNAAANSSRPPAGEVLTELKLCSHVVQAAQTVHRAHRRRVRWIAERANQITHGVGLLASVWAAQRLWDAVTATQDNIRIAGCAVYSAALISVYAASFLSHSFRTPARRHFFRTLDQVCIFFLIAGSFTPVALTYTRTPLGYSVLALMWLACLGGAAAKACITRLRNVPVWYYVLTGWIPLAAAPPIVAQIPWDGLLWIAAGAVAYTGGTWFLIHDRKRPLFHPVWHVCVLAGSACHFYTIWKYAAQTP